MGLFDKFTGGGGGPLDTIKTQMEAVGIDTSNLSLSMNGSTLVINGKLDSQADLNKINAFIKANPLFSVQNNASVISNNGGNKNNNSQEEEEEEEDYEEEDYDFSEMTPKAAQLILDALGYELGKIDGIVGANTKSAIKSFQKDYEITTNGQLDDETKSALGAAFVEDVEELSVLAVQIILEEAGHDVGYVDGIMGPKTKLAIRNFQEEYELDPTGKIDEDTLDALKESFV
jgi:Putative peptidoglycan binding domain